MSDFEYSKNTKELIDSNPFNWKEDKEATITGYQSPITMIAQEIETKIENDCVKAVQRYGFDVDAKELYKALNYDREQYQKGYEDAKRDYARPTGTWIDYSGDDGYVECPFCGHATNCEGNIDELHYCWNCGAKMTKETDDE